MKFSSLPSCRVVALFVAVACCALPTRAQKPYHPQKGTEILWDKWGVPHIFARSNADLFYSYGWAMTEAHGDLMLHAYGAGRARAAEYFGPGEQGRNVRSDRWALLNEVPQRSAEWLKAQTPEYRGYLDAFAAGINDYAAKHPEAISAEVKPVLPITALDLIEREQLFYNFEFEASSRLMVSPKTERAEVESPFDPSNQDMQDGSNGWAISPTHSENGKAMLLMNPHLAMAGEQSYFEVQLSAPGVDLYGAGQVAVPALRFMFTPQFAMTNTVNTNRSTLLYRVTEKDGGYVFDGKVLPYKTATYTFKVKQADGSFTTETVDVKKTVHGPVIRYDDGVPIALYVAGLDKPFMLEQLWKMANAKSLQEWQTQVARLNIPMYNIMYADKDGHIEYLFNANVPRRSEGDWEFWGKPAPGDSSKYLPTGSLTYEELPKLVDPASGYVQNSNEPPWDAGWPTMLKASDFPAYLSPTFAALRPDRGLRMLSTGLLPDGKMSYEMLLEKKLSTRMELADRMLPELEAAAQTYGTPLAKQAADVLKGWDRQAEASSTGALLFYTWAQKFVNPAVSVQTAAGQKNFAVKYDVNEPLTTPRGIKDPKLAAQLLDEAAQETIKTYGRLDRPWGEVMRLEINGQSDGDVSAPRGTALNGVDLPGNGGYGNLGIIRVITFGPLIDGIKTPIHGDGFTLAVEFTSPIKAKSLVTYGDCSQPGCAHHTDQLPLFEKKEWRDVWRTKAEVEQHLEKRETF
ncbi:penicillin acylase family protein [Granulicella sp. 5B5]|uniref:penicillin acylase family protein n=1 Tax=Granulicella sp. 5B5 TaxID=1617967 RepID=UPI0015F6D065|nr:penicillin acylase family protein [Granulicella sp. 5B5]QMV17760.1 penicillin acylase family protein [Granulicella sp. 5B5]